MKPMYTVHIGEYLVGEWIEKLYGSGKKAWRVWTPSRDTGIDLLVTSADCRRTVSLQVKYSKTYPRLYECKSFGWWELTRTAIENSTADFWVFVWPQFPANDQQYPSVIDFVIIPPKKLLGRLEANSKNREAPIRINLSHIGNEVVETRGIDARGKGQTRGDIPKEIQKVMKDKTSSRNYTSYFNNWKLLEAALKG